MREKRRDVWKEERILENQCDAFRLERLVHG